MRPALLATAMAIGALGLAACGTQGIELEPGDAQYEGAILFSERCAMCHTLSAAGAEGSGDRQLREQGPNFDERAESYEDVLFAIRNGGFSGAIMPQNIVVGEEAEAVAEFVAEHAGGEEPGEPVIATETPVE